MKKVILFLAVIGILATSALAAKVDSTMLVYLEDVAQNIIWSGDKLSVGVGGEIEIKSGGTLDVQSGATVNIAGLSETEAGYLDGVTPGTATASKAVVLDADKGIGTITSATITTVASTTGNITTVNATTVGATNVNATNIDAGASGTAGSFDLFPTTAAKGRARFVAADNLTDVVRSYTVPAVGADGNVLIHAGIAGDGLVELITEEATVVIGGAAAEVATGLTYPAGCIPFVAHGNVEVIVVATTATKIGLDATGGSSGYGLAAALTKNTKLRHPTISSGFGGVYNQGNGFAVIASTPLFLVACDNAGAAAGTINSGTVRVRISYWKCADLVNAP